MKFIIHHQSNIRKQSGPKLFHDPIFSFSFGSECFILENILPAKKLMLCIAYPQTPEIVLMCLMEVWFTWLMQVLCSQYIWRSHPYQDEKWKLTKHIEQVKSMSTLTESKSSQVSDGLSSLNVRLHASNNAGAFLELILLSLKLMWKAMSSQSQGLWRISMCMLWACDLKAWPCLE